jgi:glycosyltransferase involved in cell wall biosynthesis
VKVLFSLLDSAVGGGQRVALEVAQRLAADGDGVGLLVPDEGPAAEEFRALGAAVHRADLQTLRRTDGIGPAAGIARGFDLLYSHTSVPGEILGAGVARRAGIAHVVHRHTDPYFSPRALTRLAQRRLYRRDLRATPFVAVALHVAASLERLGIESGRITVVSNGVDIEAVRERGRRIGARGATLSVGALGRFDPSRGLDVFAEAVEQTNEPSVAFVIGGSPGAFREHEAAVRRAAAKSSVVMEEPGSAGIEFLASLDVVVIPSRYEGSPITLFEAMALGKPIIASRIPGIAEVLEPSSAGVLVPPEDVGALSQAIDGLSRNRDRRRTLGEAALALVRERYTLDRMVTGAIAALENAASA